MMLPFVFAKGIRDDTLSPLMESPPKINAPVMLVADEVDTVPKLADVPIDTVPDEVKLVSSGFDFKVIATVLAPDVIVNALEAAKVLNVGGLAVAMISTPSEPVPADVMFVTDGIPTTVAPGATANLPVN